MAGLIGHGVAQGRRPDRRRRGDRRPSPARSWGYFVLVTIGLSWITAAAIGPPWTGDGGAAARLLRASTYYAAVMGWPPLVGAWLARWARDEQADAGVHGAPVRELAIAVAIAVGLIASAALLAAASGEAATGPADLGATTAGAALGIVVVLGLQAMTEEYGWRGSPLAWAVERWGARAGLVVHGIAWGAWYAPLFLVSGAAPATALAAAGGFAITCVLLGIVLGWLRLRSESLLPPVLANAILTILAGLPLVLQGGSAGARDAIFRWPGWPVIGGLALAVLMWRGRDLARAPGAGAVTGGGRR